MSSADHAKLELGNGNNRVNSIGDYTDITLGNGNNQITSSADYAKLKLGNGNNKATLSGNSATVYISNGCYDLSFRGSMGSLVFVEHTTFDRLQLKHKDQNLQISVIGSMTEVTLRNWYAATPERPNDIVIGNGEADSSKRLSQYDVEQLLVQAMAGFTEPGAVTSSSTPVQQPVTQPVLAANWH